MERYKLQMLLLSDKDVDVLLESLWHSMQRADVPGEDHERMVNLREQLVEKFKRGVGE